MDKTANKSTESSFSTTGTPNYSDNVDNVNYMNLNFIDNSESSSQARDAIKEYQKLKTSSEQTKLTKPPPSKILPNLLALPGLDNNKNEPTLKEKSLLEMGFNANEVEGWENIVQPPKENLYKLLKNMIINHIKPNVQIRIGGVNFNCHMMVLQCYSDFFMECNNEVLIQLPEEKITPGAFMMVYDWMLAEEPLVQREGILELFNAANFLRIKELINQCWLCLDDDVRFREDTAFLLYLEARNYGLESLEQLMLMRICKFFLTLVASREFLTLNAKEICTLMSSNTIGVNTEIEILMSVARWLSHNWEEREEHMLDVIKCVRFNLMPPWFLVTLTKNSDCIEIDRIVNHAEVKKMINDGMSYTTTQLYYGENREEFLHFLERYQLIAPMQRQWVFDKQCSYHHRFECPNMQHITYKSFLEYLEMIQTIGKDYWRSLEMAKEKSLQCCLRSDCRKSFDTNLTRVVVNKSRDQGIQCESKGKSRRGRDNSKTNLIHDMKSKTTLRKTPRGHPKYVPASAAATIYSINNDNTTEAETTVDFKYPKESQQQKLQQEQENILYDNNHQQTDVEEQQHIANCHSVHHATAATTTNNIDNNVKSKQRQGQKHHHSQTFSKSRQVSGQQQQPHKLQQQQEYNKTTPANCTVIYKRDGNIMADCSGNTNQEGPFSHPHHQHGKQQCIIANNNNDDDDDVELMKNNLALVIEKLVGYNEDLPESRTKPSNTTVADLKSIPNHKILVFGGIDPYCLHGQHVQQHHHNQQQQPSRKRVLSIDTTMNTRHHHHQNTCSSQHPHHHRRHGGSHHLHRQTHATNAFANNKFDGNFGDHVLLYDIHDKMEWRHLSHIPFGSRHHHAVVVCNGLIYVIGGTRTALGRTEKSDFEKSVWCFNPQTLKWTLETNLPELRKDFAAIAIEEQKSKRSKGTKKNRKGANHESGFYVIGGAGVNGTALRTVWFYNIKCKLWIKKPSLNLGRYGLAAAMVNNEIWVVGGIINDNSAGVCGNNNGETTKSTTAAGAGAHVITDTMEIYNLKCTHEILPNNDAVEGFANITYGNGSSGDGVGNKGMGNNDDDDDDGIKGKYDTDISLQYKKAAGGAGGDNGLFGILNKNCDCNVGQWIKSKLHLRVPRVFGKFCKMSNGHLYLVGGIGLSKKGDLISVPDIDKYNVEQNKWEHYGDLNWARHGHDVGRLNDHCFAVIGGVSTLEKCTLNKVEAFCTTTRKCLKDLPDLPWPVSGCAVVTLS